MRPFPLFIFLTWSLLRWCVPLQAQDPELRVISDGELPKKVKQSYTIDQRNTPELLRKRIITHLFRKGYLAASFDSCVNSNGSYDCFLHVGEVYRWVALDISQVDREITSAAHLREKTFDDRPLSPFAYERAIQNILRQFEESGHPFAKVWMDSIEHVDHGISARLRAERGRIVTVDSVIVKGETRTAPVLIHNQISIRPGDLYQESLIANASRRLRQLPYISQQQEPYVLFGQEKTKLFLFLKDKKASQVSGILGVLPNEATGKVLLTGDIDLRLKNALRRGEGINLKWRSLQDQTQDLKVGFIYPFILNTPFGTDLSLSIFRRDTTFLEVISKAGIDLLLDQGDKITAFVRNKRSNRLGDLTLAQAGLADTRTLSYGLAVHRQRFDEPLNPRRGHQLEMSGSVGNKRSQTGTNSSDAAVSATRTVQFELDGRFIWHIAWSKRGSFRVAGMGATMVNEVLFRNELFRIGGIQDMRGVDDASIFCSSYAIGTVEVRWLLEERSNVLLFVDQGWWEDRTVENFRTDDPLSFGIGTNFETKAGIFSLTYALGKQFENPVELRNGKVHFGFLSLF